MFFFFAMENAGIARRLRSIALKNTGNSSFFDRSQNLLFLILRGFRDESTRRRKKKKRTTS